MATHNYSRNQSLRAWISCAHLIIACVMCITVVRADESTTGTNQSLLNLFLQREYGQVIAIVESQSLQSEVTLADLQSIYLAAESFYALGNEENSHKYFEFWLAHAAKVNHPSIEKLRPYCRFRLAQIHAHSSRNTEAIATIRDLMSREIPPTLLASAKLQLAWILAETQPDIVEAKVLCDASLQTLRLNSHDHLSALLLKATLLHKEQRTDAAIETLKELRTKNAEHNKNSELAYKSTLLLLQISNANKNRENLHELVKDLQRMQAPSQRLLELARLEVALANLAPETRDEVTHELAALGRSAIDSHVRRRAWLQMVRLEAGKPEQDELYVQGCQALLDAPDLPEEIRSEVTFRLAKTNIDSGNADQGIKLLQKSLGVMSLTDRWRLPSLLLLAESSYQVEQFSLARESFAKILANPELSQELEVRYLSTLRLGEIAAIENDWSQADQFASDLRAATEDFQYAAATKYLLGRIAVAKGELDAARDFLVAAKQLAKAHENEIAARSQWLIGETYFLQKNYVSAIGNYEAVLDYRDQLQWCAVSELQAAKCREALGEWSAAIAIYQRLLVNYPDSIHLEEIKERLELANQSEAVRLASKNANSAR